MKVLEEIRDDAQHKPGCRHDATCLVKSMDIFETGIMTVFCGDVLQRFTPIRLMISLMIQDPQIDISSVISLLDSRIEITTSQRSRIDLRTLNTTSH